MLGYFDGFQLDLCNICNKHFFAFYDKNKIRDTLKILMKYCAATVSFYVKWAKNIIFNLIDQL